MNRTYLTVKLLFCTFFVWSSINVPIAYAQIINYENHPNLTKAMEYDSELNGHDMEKANREKAVYHYLRYLEDATDSFQKARVYCQLGAMYAVSFNYHKGESADYDKAREYYQKVLDLEPNRIGRPTIVARNMLSTLTNDGGMERIKARIDMFKWLDEINEEKIRNSWLPFVPAPKKEDGSSEDQSERENTEILSKYSARPSNNQLIKLRNLVANLKEGSIYNASYDAKSMENSNEGFMYILDNLPISAPERNMAVNIYKKNIDNSANEIIKNLTPDIVESEVQVDSIAMAKQSDNGAETIEVSKGIESQTSLTEKVVAGQNSDSNNFIYSAVAGLIVLGIIGLFFGRNYFQKTKLQGN